MSLLKSTHSYHARTALLVAMLLAFGSPCLRAQQASGAGNKPASSAAPDEVHTTAPVIVNGRVNPLVRSDRKLARIKKSLPGSVTHSKKPSTVLGRYAAAHDDPNAATGQQRLMMERANEPAAGNGPDGGIGPH